MITKSCFGAQRPIWSLSRCPGPRPVQPARSVVMRLRSAARARDLQPEAKATGTIASQLGVQLEAKGQSQSWSAARGQSCRHHYQIIVTYSAWIHKWQLYNSIIGNPMANINANQGRTMHQQITFYNSLRVVGRSCSLPSAFLTNLGRLASTFK